MASVEIHEGRWPALRGATQLTPDLIDLDEEMLETRVSIEHFLAAPATYYESFTQQRPALVDVGPKRRSVTLRCEREDDGFSVTCEGVDASGWGDSPEEAVIDFVRAAEVLRTYLEENRNRLSKRLSDQLPLLLALRTP